MGNRFQRPELRVEDEKEALGRLRLLRNRCAFAAVSKSIELLWNIPLVVYTSWTTSGCNIVEIYTLPGFIKFDRLCGQLGAFEGLFPEANRNAQTSRKA